MINLAARTIYLLVKMSCQLFFDDTGILGTFKRFRCTFISLLQERIEMHSLIKRYVDDKHVPQYALMRLSTEHF